MKEPGLKIASIQSAVRNRHAASPVHIRDVASRPPRQYLVPGLIPEESITLLTAASGTGKTFVALSLAAIVATGADWQGTVLPCRCVVYVAAEGDNGFGDRTRALMSRFPRLDSAPFYVEFKAPRLHIDAEVDLWATTLLEKCPKPDLLVFDTLSKSMVGADENSSKDMPLAVDALERLRDRLSAAILVIHHVGKDSGRGARGHSSLHAGVEARFTIAREKGVGLAGCLRVDHQKDGPTGASFRWRLEGEGTLRSVRWIPGQLNSPAVSREPVATRVLGRTQNIVLSELESLTNRCGVNNPRLDKRVVPTAKLVAAVQRRVRESAERPTQATRPAKIRAVIAGLRDNGLVHWTDDCVWLA